MARILESRHVINEDYAIRFVPGAVDGGAENAWRGRIQGQREPLSLRSLIT